MKNFQLIVEDILSRTGASRVLLQFLAADGHLASVAEAVTQGTEQIRNRPLKTGSSQDATFNQIDARNLLSGEIIEQPDVDQIDSPAVLMNFEKYDAKARILAPLVNDGFIGVLSVHDVFGTKKWERNVIDAVQQGRDAVLSLIGERDRKPDVVVKEELRDIAIQAVLDDLRQRLQVQRCTLRQNVSETYAFPVTHESREPRVRSLLGDLTIDQTGQPVIKAMLAEGLQVVQNDTRSATGDPVFHIMLDHYGDMRSQIVTPLCRGEAMQAVLSIHSLEKLRNWSATEIDIARSASSVLGLLVGASLKRNVGSDSPDHDAF